MKKVLVVGMTENPGGLEAVIKNYISQMELVSFDFLCNTNNKVAYEDYFSERGSVFYHITPRSQNPFKFRKELIQFFEKFSCSYDTIWVNLNTLTNIDYLVLAKKYGIKRRIIHSHNSKHKDHPIRIALHYINCFRIKSLATDYWACEEAASEWFYPPILKNSVKIIPNAIEIEKFKYSQKSREVIRTELNWSDKFIIGNIGRFHYQKNQSFIVDVFEYYYKKNIDARLVLVGDGEDRQIIESKVKEKQLEEVVYFAGLQTDVSSWLSSFDVLLFPSIYEGLSVALLEAQANGIPIVANKNVFPPSLLINSNLLLLKLDDPLAYWGSNLEKVNQNEIIRPKNDVEAKLSEAGFNIKTESIKLQNDFLKGNFSE